MVNIEKIIEGCKRNDRKSQKQLYDIYSPVLFGICVRYSQDKPEAEDILQEGFIKILTKISDYSGKGSFEGWMKRIMVNTSITHYHRNKKHSHNYDFGEIYESKIDGDSYKTGDYTRDELLNVIKSLPDGYRMVFNMYAIEGYKHKEIADKLNIDVNTSKSQYSRAKKLLRTKLSVLSKINLNE